MGNADLDARGPLVIGVASAYPVASSPSSPRAPLLPLTPLLRLPQAAASSQQPCALLQRTAAAAAAAASAPRRARAGSPSSTVVLRPWAGGQLVDLGALGFAPAQSLLVHDVWRNATLGPVFRNFTTRGVDAHETLLLRLSLAPTPPPHSAAV